MIPLIQMEMQNAGWQIQRVCRYSLDFTNDTRTIGINAATYVGFRVAGISVRFVQHSESFFHHFC